MITIDKTYTTRDGNKVTIYCIDDIGKYPVHGSFNDKGVLTPCNWNIDGFIYTNGFPDHLDLIEVIEN